MHADVIKAPEVFMKRTVLQILKIVVLLAVFYLAFRYLGTGGGIAVAVIYLVISNLPSIFNSLAGDAYKKGDPGKAIKRLEAALKLNPSNYAVRGSFALLLLKLGRTDEAEAEIDKALSQADIADIRNQLAVTKSLVLWKKGRLDEAISMLENLIQKYKTSNVYGTLGFFYIERGDLDKALSFNLEAYEYNNTSTVILDNLGCTRLLRGEYEEARKIYQELIKMKPNFPEAFYNYARVLAHFHDFDEAIYMCRTALLLNFWNTNTVTREEVENYLKELEAMKSESSGPSEKENGTVRNDENADIQQ